MNNQDLSNMILGDEARIAEAISTGAAWEIWMQVELIILFRRLGIRAARELPYPADSKLRLDVLAQDNGGQYAIELKVESATNAGTALLSSVQQDIDKITAYQAPAARWVVAIGYSADAKSALQACSENAANNAIYRTTGAIGIGVMVVTV
jgi:hypothetical protein